MDLGQLVAKLCALPTFGHPFRIKILILYLMLELLRGCALNCLRKAEIFEHRCRAIVFSMIIVIIIVIAHYSVIGVVN